MCAEGWRPSGVDSVCSRFCAEGKEFAPGRIPPHDGSGPAHIGIGITAESLGAWQTRLRAHDLPIEATLKWPGGGTSIYFRDPDKHLVELVTPGTWTVTE